MLNKWMYIIVLSTRVGAIANNSNSFKPNCSVISEQFCCVELYYMIFFSSLHPVSPSRVHVCIYEYRSFRKCKSALKLFGMSLQSSHIWMYPNAKYSLYGFCFMCLPPPRNCMYIAQQVYTNKKCTWHIPTIICMIWTLEKILLFGINSRNRETERKKEREREKCICTIENSMFSLTMVQQTQYTWNESRLKHVQ